MHVIQRANNRQACFQGEDDILFYLDCLESFAVETRQAAYRKLFRGRLSADFLAAARHAFDKVVDDQVLRICSTGS